MKILNILYVLLITTALSSCTVDNLAANDTADADYIDYTIGFGGYNTYTPYYWNNYYYPGYAYSRWPARYNYNNYYYRNYPMYRHGYYRHMNRVHPHYHGHRR